MRVRPTIIREDSHQIAASAAAAAMTNDMSHINAYSAGSIATNDSNDQLFLIREERWKTIRNLVFFGLSQLFTRTYKYRCDFASALATTAALTMVFKLYGVYRSPWVRLVAAVLVEKQIPFELVSVDLANGEHKSPEYLAKHPFGQVPYIVCDSLIFWLLAESRFIQCIPFGDLIRTMTVSSSTKAEPYAII